MTSRIVDIIYKTNDGRTINCRLEPLSFTFNGNKTYPEPQWLLIASDLNDDGKPKLYAIQRILKWMPVVTVDHVPSSRRGRSEAPARSA